MTDNNFFPEVLNVADLPAAAIASRIADMRTGDAVELVNELDADDAVAVIAQLSHEDAIRLLDQPELHRATEIIAMLPPGLASLLLDGMSADRATDVFQELEDDDRAGLFPILAPETKVALKKLMGYPPNTAGSLMTIEFIAVPSNWNVGQTLDYIRKVERTRETVYAIYVVDPASRVLLGACAVLSSASRTNRFCPSRGMTSRSRFRRWQAARKSPGSFGSMTFWPFPWWMRAAISSAS